MIGWVKGGWFGILAIWLCVDAWSGQPPPPLAHGWKRDSMHVYRVTVASEEKEYLPSLRGHVVLTCRAANPHGFTLRSHRFLSAQRHARTGRRFPPFGLFRLGWVYFDGRHGEVAASAPRDFVFAPEGRLLGNAPVFDLAGAESLIIPRLPKGKERKWRRDRSVTILHERPERLSDGTRRVKIHKTSLAAVERVDYEWTGTEIGLEVVTLRLSLQTAATDGQPRVAITGTGKLYFHALKGWTEGYSFNGTLFVTDAQGSRESPLRLAAQRLEGAERERVLMPPAPASPNDRRTLPAEELDRLKQDLVRSVSQHRQEAALRLARAAPERDEAALRPLLVAALEDTDPFARRAVLRALAVWGDASTVPAMLARLEDPHLTVRWAALDALGMLKDRRAVKPVARHLAGGHETAAAANALLHLGRATAEVETEIMRLSQHELPAVRRAVCDVLAEIGTFQSATLLRGLVIDEDSTVAAAAGKALRTVIARARP